MKFGKNPYMRNQTAKLLKQSDAAKIAAEKAFIKNNLNLFPSSNYDVESDKKFIRDNLDQFSNGQLFKQKSDNFYRTMMFGRGNNTNSSRPNKSKQPKQMALTFVGPKRTSAKHTSYQFVNRSVKQTLPTHSYRVNTKEANSPLGAVNASFKKHNFATAEGGRKLSTGAYGAGTKKRKQRYRDIRRLSAIRENLRAKKPCFSRYN